MEEQNNPVDQGLRDMQAQQLGYDNDAQFQRMLDQAERHLEQLEMEEVNEIAQPEAIEQVRDELSEYAEAALHTPKLKKKRVARPKSKEDEFKETILRIATDYIGEENVCIESFRSILSNHDALIIRWPEIHMTNSRGHRHSLKDMMVAMPITNGRFNGGLHGARMTLSHVEYHSGYRHSHLYAGIQGFTNFCTGADGINDLWSSLTIDGYGTDDFELRFEGFLHQMYSFLSYESLEGVPYIRMNNIGYNSSRHYSGSNMTRDIRRILREVTEGDFQISMDFNTAEVSVVETDYLHSMMAMASSTHQYREANGMYSDIDNIRSGRPRVFNGEYLQNVEIPFKGEMRRVYVEPIINDLEEDEQIERKKYAHSSATNEIFQRLEEYAGRRLQNICIENYVQEPAEKKGPSNYWKRFNGADRLLPCQTTESGVVRRTVLEDEQGSGSGESADNSN